MKISDENELKCFAVGRDDFLVVHWHKSTNTWTHQNESATTNDLALTLQGFDTGLARNIATELNHLLVMLTR